MKTSILIFGITIFAILATSCTNDTNSMQNTSQKIPIERIDSLISVMTLEEKISMIHANSSFTSGGIERLGIPELVKSDGPHGVRHEHGRGWFALDNVDDRSTYLPVGINLASTWSEELAYVSGEVLGNEAKDRGKHILLGPGVNIIRSPLNGRNFEYFSEDPFLNARIAVGYVQGLQNQGVAANVKHYAANNQETDRHNIDVLVSKRALHEIYFPAFEAAVKEAGAWSIMGAYNKINGQYTTHHEYLNNQILKGEWEFDGVVISDWASVKDTREALLYGTDIEMGTELVRDFNNPDYDNFYMANPAIELVKNGEIPEHIIDDKVRRILTLMYRTTALGSHSPGKRNVREHQQVALKVAQESLVLLKNDGLLPLERSEIRTLAVIGHNANRKFAERGGSSQVPALYEITPLEGIQQLVGDQVNVVWAEGYEPYYDESLFRGFSNEAASQSRERRDEIALARTANLQLRDEAIDLVRTADAVIFVGGWIHGHDGMPWGEGTYDAEARDKLNLKLLFGQEELIREIASVNPNTAVVLMGGSNVEMDGWLPNVNAYLHAWYPGMEGGTAIAQVLFGDVNPSGKLPVTFANSHEEYPSHSVGEFPGDGTVAYDEDIYVGYRYFDKERKDVVFPFGFGMSYTSFELSDMKLSQQDSKVTVRATVTNTGNRDGSEVVQIYVEEINPSIDRPLRELKGFQKIELAVGATGEVVIELDERSFSYFDPDTEKWTLNPGTFNIYAGTSSRDLPLSESVEIR